MLKDEPGKNSMQLCCSNIITDFDSIFIEVHNRSNDA